jgi:hypothetical protein
VEAYERPEVLEAPEPVYDDAGVDRSLVRWMLSLTPTERLAWLESVNDVVQSVRRAEPR